jgi:L-alanine-DL-glutamate epimerase-like enolase superfamily enzyme
VSDSPKVRGVEVVEFWHDASELAPEPTIGFPVYTPGAKMRMNRNALRILTDVGVVGEYVGGAAIEYSTIPTMAPMLIGRNALEREGFYNDMKRVLRQSARLGLGVVDITLWDFAGKLDGKPIFQLLGGRDKPLPAYASTSVGDRVVGGLNTPEAYADFAERCRDLGYRGFKIHPWGDATIDEHVALVRAVGKRVGGTMDLMLDPFCSLLTFADALRVGRACDEYGYLWLEDPYRDGGVSNFGHRKLKELIKTPLLELEHVRGLEAHVDMIVGGGTDFVRGDPDYDGGVTGTMKIAHAAEGFGLDIELHGPGPVRRQLMASIENTNYYEIVAVHPVAPNFVTVAQSGYPDQLDEIDASGCVRVPLGPGLGVTYDWDLIRAHQVGGATYGDCS